MLSSRTEFILKMSENIDFENCVSQNRVKISARVLI